MVDVQSIFRKIINIWRYDIRVHISQVIITKVINHHKNYMRFLAEASVSKTFSKNKKKDKNKTHFEKQVLSFADGDQEIRKKFSAILFYLLEDKKLLVSRELPFR